MLFSSPWQGNTLEELAKAFSSSSEKYREELPRIPTKSGHTALSDEDLVYKSSEEMLHV